MLTRFYSIWKLDHTPVKAMSLVITWNGISGELSDNTSTPLEDASFPAHAVLFWWIIVYPRVTTPLTTFWYRAWASCAVLHTSYVSLQMHLESFPMPL